MSWKVSLHLKPLKCPRSHHWSQQTSKSEVRDETLAPENTEMEAGKELRDEKNHKFGDLT